MKKIYLLYLGLFLAPLVYGQTLTIPMAEGGNYEGGTILSVNTLDGTYTAYSNPGKIGTNSYLQSTGDLGGMTYVPANNSIYVLLNTGQRETGAPDGMGMLFKYDLSQNTTSIIKSFSYFNTSSGIHPQGGLTLSGNKLYGTCIAGGENEDGLIFYIDITDDSYHILTHFDEPITGGAPTCEPIVVGNFLYGGGKHSTNGHGYMLYRYNLTTDSLENIIDAPSSSSNTYPILGLYERNGLIYYTAINDINYYNPSDGTYHTHFVGQSGIGKEPVGFTYNNGDGSWYTNFTYGGQHNKGSIGKIIYSNPKVINEHSFTSGSEYPISKLTAGLQGDMYGVIHTDNFSTSSKLYKYTVTGIYSELYTFSGGSDGRFVRMPPVLVGTDLYGISEWEGDYGTGVLWKYDLLQDTLGIVNQLGFYKGRSPIRQVTPTTQDEFIGLMSRGGFQDQGVLFRFNQLTQDMATENIIDPDISDIYYQPFTYQDSLYGILELKLSAAQNYNSYTVIARFDSANHYFNEFTPVSPSVIPGVPLPTSIMHGNVIQEDSLLYGCTDSQFWKYNLSTKKLTVLHDFDYAQEGRLVSHIEKSGSVIYGVLTNDGTHGNGCLFSYDLSQDLYSVLYSPTKYALQNVTWAGTDSLIGATYSSDSSQYGTMYLFDVASNQFSELQAFDSSSTGFITTGGWVWDGELAYAATRHGNTHNEGGIVVYNKQSNTLQSLLAFDQNTGRHPWNSTPVLTSNITSVSQINRTEIKIYPNPSAEFINITCSTPVYSGAITDINGRVIKTFSAHKAGELLHISTSDLAPGAYIIRLNTPDQIRTQKFIKE